ncbi:hypothetical protein [Gardnerella vaginalis]|uniref:hypothetical protein n=1 Tax=Gardnerella vaginalis TaxID=2702 RepID=UPI0039EE40E2
MKVCAQCGTQNIDTAKFCKGCGNKFEAAQQAPVQPAPAQPAPVQHAPAQPAPAQPAPAQPATQHAPQFARPSMPQPGMPHQGAPQQGMPNMQRPGYPYAQQGMPAQPGMPGMQNRPNTPGVSHYSQISNQLNAEQMMNFFRWLVTALKNPSQKYRVSNLYAALIALISGLLFGLQGYLSSMTIVNAWISQVTGFANALSTSSGGPSIPTTPGVPFTVFLYKFIIGVLTVYAVYAVALLGMKMFGDEVSPAQLHVLFAQKLVPLVGLQIVATVLAFIPPSRTALIGLMSGQASNVMNEYMSGNSQAMSINFDSVDASLFIHNPSLALQIPSVALQALYLVLLILVPVSFLATARYKGKLDREWMWVIFILVGVIAMFIVSAIDKSFMTSAWSGFWTAYKNVPSLPKIF